MAQYEERRRTGTRLTIVQYLIAAVFAILVVSFWVLQVVQHAKFEELAENNHQRTLALRAPRGIVFDRNGQVLVQNRHSYSVSIVREHTKDLNRTIRLLAVTLGLDEPGIRAIVNRHRSEPSYRPITIIQDATLAQVADHIEHVAKVAGVDHVGIGCDFAGDGGPVGLEDVSRYPYLFAELIRRGWKDDDLRKLASGNLIRAMSGAEGVAARLQGERPPSMATIEKLDGPRD